MLDFEFHTPPDIVVRNGAARDLGALVKERFEIRHILVVTDKGLIKAGVPDTAIASLKKAGIAVTIFDDVIADPPESVIFRALEVAKASGIDCVLGLGGGSSMDTAKVIAVLMSGRQELADIYGVGNVTGRRETPLIQIPTTAGTGSEVTPISIITTGETTKAGIVAPQLYADTAIMDAELTVGLPAGETAATGIDAMVHAIEAYTSRHRKNPVSDMLAREALTKLSANLVRACEKGDDLDARSEMLLGAMMAGQAFANAPVAAVHALAYPVGGIFHVSHGLSNALVLPHVLRFNLPDAAGAYAELMTVLRPSATGSEANRAESFIDHLEELRVATAIPRKLTEVGINQEDIPRLAADAMLQTRLLVNNPREVTEADATAIYSQAL